MQQHTGRRSHRARWRNRWGAPSAGRATMGIIGVTVLSALSLVGVGSSAQAVPGTPGTPQSGSVVYSEDFENGVTSPTYLEDYVGADGTRYTADASWRDHTQCNGNITSFASSAEPQCLAASASGEGRTRQLAWALGAGDTANHSVSAWTSQQTLTMNPPNAVEFATVDPIALTSAGRYLTTSVDLAAVSCNASQQPVLEFFLTDDQGGAHSVGAINGCTAAGSRSVTAPATGAAGAENVRVGTYVSPGAVLLPGATVGIVARNLTGGGTAGNDHAFDNIQVLDVSPQLDKSFSPASVVAGETSTLTLTITNTDELAAKNGWSFTDALPAGLTIADGDASTTCPSGVVTAPEGGSSIDVTGNLSQGMTSCAVTVEVTSPVAGTFTNGPDNITSVGLNPPADATVEFVPQAPAITVVKSASPVAAEYAVGDEITYSFLVTNTGNVTLTDVQVDEGTFTGTGELSDVVCPPGAATLAPAAAVTCEATYTMTQADIDAGTVSNSATATGTPPQGRPPVSPPSEVTIPGVAQAPALTVAKSATPTTGANAGEDVTYSFLVTNTGNVTLTDVSVVEGEFTGTGELSDVVCPAAAGSLAPAATVTCEASYTVTQADVDAGSVTNSATATGTPPAGGTPPVSPPSETTVAFPAAPAITVAKSATPTTVANAGEDVTYSFLVTNTGNVTLSDVSVVEGQFTGTGELSQVVCPPAAGSLAPAATVTCEATYTVTQADVDAGSVTNTATATGTPPNGGTPPVSPPSETTVAFPATPAITVVKSADAVAQGGLAVGQVVTYSFLLTNTGNVTLTNPTVVEGEFSGAGEVSDVVCPAEAASLAPGATITCEATYTVVQADVDAGLITNSATATATPPNSVNGVPPVSPPSEVTIPSPPVPGLSVVKTADVERATTAGQVITYSFQVTNTGNVTLRDVAVQEGDFTGTGTLSAITCPTGTALLAPGLQVVCTATYTVTQADLNAGSIRNTAFGTGVTPGGESFASGPSTAIASTPGPVLASTGTTVAPLVVGAAVLLLLGTGLVIRRRLVTGR
ncbi:DUF11 domain-containing protein [Plantibacter sp. MMLR14_011]|uniref:DUF7507 domain-containing protein n=1 Tax=Plantibacter sp. MMLR14_011 TaxID=1898746 RepID=UPI0009F5D710|nr:DUF11 domain-containing protein [Plantibacter sp. MMLR14_011]